MIGSSGSGYYSWFRENVRFGMLVECPSGSGKLAQQADARLIRDAHPADFGEAVYERGHFLSVDPLVPIGRDIMLSRRRAWFDKIKGVGKAIAELNREPGPDPWNQRVRRDFRKWLQTKYGDLATLNRVWGQAYEDWSDVGPAHLPPKEGRYGRVQTKHLRFDAHEKNPARYYDWFLFMMDDTTASNRVETEDLRRHWPGMVTCDARSHLHEQDGYAAYCPDLLEPLWDLMFIHQGWSPVRYGKGPYDESTLIRTTAFPLFCFNYYRTNLKKPIVSAENVVSRIGVPGSSIDAMTRNDIAKFHEGGWEFQLGETPDANAWQPIRVPGCWDEQPAWKLKSGTGWYRHRFKVPPQYLHDFEDGSRKFLLYGQGLAQNGEFLINGTKVGKVTGNAWNRKYAFDVGSQLRFGKENEILIKVNGTGSQNGIRNYIHLLADDMIMESSAPDERMHRHMLWSYMMGGVSGEFNWNWNREDPIRPYLPNLLDKMNAVAPFVLPDVRNRRSRVAILHAYAYFRGLPWNPTGKYAEGVKLNDACAFLGVRPSVVSEWKLAKFLDENPVETLIVPEARIVEDSTYATVCAFLKKGGTVVLSGHALERTFSRYAETDVGTLECRAGNGRVVRISPEMTLESAMDTLQPLLPKPDLSLVKVGPAEERPMVERVFLGDADHKVVYLANWGGCCQRLMFELPPEIADWKRTTLEGKFKGSGNRLAVEVESQDVAVALFERPGVQTCWAGVSSARSKAMARVVELMADEKVPIAEDTRKKVLFPDENLEFRDAFTGMKLYPYWVLAFRQRGCRVDAVPREKWTDELVSHYDVVMLPENYKAQWVATGGAGRYGELMKGVLERGGSVCSFANVNGIANNAGLIAGTAAKLVGATWDRNRPIPEDPNRATFGDARQITTAEVVPSELTKDVRRVVLYTGYPFCYLTKAHVDDTIVSSCGRPVMIASEVGKGRLFVSADAMFGQPLRIEEADNANLVANVVGWLLREQTGVSERAALRGELFLKENVFRSDSNKTCSNPLGVQSYVQHVLVHFQNSKDAERSTARVAPLFANAAASFGGRWDDSTDRHLPKCQMEKEIGFKTTCFANGKLSYLQDCAPEVLSLGHSIGNHTATHPHMFEISDEACWETIVLNRANIETNTDQTVISYVSPFGWHAPANPKRSKLIAEMLIASGHYTTSDGPFPSIAVSPCVWFRTNRFSANDKDPDAERFRVGFRQCLKSALSNKSIPRITFGTHAWSNAAGTEVQRKLLKEVLSGHPELWIASDNEYGAYRYEYLNGKVEKIGVKGDAAVFAVTRFDPAQTGSAQPLSLLFDIQPVCVEGARKNGETWTLPHAKDRAAPLKIDGVDEAGHASGFVGLSFRILPDTKHSEVEIVLENAGKMPIRNAHVVLMLPPLWSVLRQTFDVGDLPPGRCWHRRCGLGTHREPICVTDSALYAATVDFSVDKCKGRVWALSKVKEGFK